MNATFRISGQVEDALLLARQDHRVFPCDGKEPRVKWKEAATTDPDVIREWWQRWPTANIGVALDPGTMAVDIDDPKAVAALDLDLPATVFQGTARDGLHLFYRLDERDAPQLVKRDGAPLDTRIGGKGYVIAWEPDEWTVSSSWTAAPEWVYAAPSSPAVVRDESEPLTTDADIVSWLGHIIASSDHKFTRADLIAMQENALHDGRIVATDPRRPWTTADFDRHCDAAEKWEPRKSGVLNLRDRNTPRSDIEITCGTISALELPSDAPPDMLLDGWLHPEETTILYGKGGVGKGVTSAWLAGRLVTEHNLRPYILDYENHEREWGTRLAGLHENDVRKAIQYGCPYSRRWTEKKGPLITIVDVVAEEMARVRSDYLILDSYSAATTTNDKLGGQESAIELAEALARIGVPVLLTAHVAGGQQRHPDRPFGSVFVHNLVARRTWSVEPDGEPESPASPFEPHIVKLEYRNQKHNDGPKLRDRRVMVAFFPNGEVKVTEDVEAPRRAEDMIADALGRTPGMTQKQIVGAIAEWNAKPLSAEVVKKVLQRDTYRFVCDAKTQPYHYSLRESA